MVITILVADDHQIVRQGLSALLDQEADMEVVGEARDGREAVQLSQKLSPHLVLMDVSMPFLNGIEATRQILAVSPKTKVVGLSMHVNRQFVVNMFQAGASGYILKDCAFEDLTRAIRQVMGGVLYLSPGVNDLILRDYLELLISRGNGSAFTVLSPREREVLQLLAEGLSSSKIGHRLCISVKTVDTHRNQIMHKLGLYSVAELTKYAIREGLTTAEW